MNSTKNKTQLESDLFEHFQEMRFQIDEYRKRLKEKIDDIALDSLMKQRSMKEIHLKNPKRERVFI